MLDVAFRPRAAFDVESIATYIGLVLDSPQAAEAWYANLTQTIELLRACPDLGRRLSDDRLSNREYRSYLVDSYRIFYTSTDTQLIIWRVVHTSQNIDDYQLIDFG